MEFCVWLKPTVPPVKVAEWARVAEECGFNYVGMTDGQMIWRDVYVCLSAASLVTSQIKLAPWVTNPYTRHPTVTANALSTLDELSNGRAVLGLGTGDDSVRTIGEKPVSLSMAGDAIDLIRTLHQGKDVENKGVKLRQYSAHRQLPIYWAGANYDSLEFGSEHADGVIMSGFLHNGYLEKASGHIKKGAEKAGKSVKDVKVFFNSGIAISGNKERALEAARPYIAKGLTYAVSREVFGWTVERYEEFRRSYNYYKHLSDDIEVANLITNEMIHLKAIAGTADDCIKQLEFIDDAGIAAVALAVMGRDDEIIPSLKLIGKEVIPSFH